VLKKGLKVRKIETERKLAAQKEPHIEKKRGAETKGKGGKGGGVKDPHLRGEGGSL